MSEDKFEYVMNTFFYVLFAILGIFAFVGAVVYLRFDLLVIAVGLSGLSICLFLENAKTKNQIGKVNSALGGNSSRITPDGEKEY